jgi:nucleotide-binding universal stress UspA family protein
MFRNVLVGVDGRPFGRDAVALARRLGEPDARLTLAFVQADSLTENVEDSTKLLQEERRAAGIEAELTTVLAVSPGRGLHEEAERAGVDLLVVGSCGHGAFGRAMIAAHGFAEHPASLARVGVAYNETPESDAALALAKELAAANGATVHALEVVSIPSIAYAGLIAPAIGETIDALLQEAEGRMHELPGVEGGAVYGIAGEELAAFGHQLDLLVVGSRGYGPVRRLVLGSTSDYLERHARCSLLVLPRVASVGEAVGVGAHAV